MVVRLLPALLAMSISSFGGEAQMLWVTVKDGGKLCIAHTREVSCSEVPPGVPAKPQGCTGHRDVRFPGGCGEGALAEARAAGIPGTGWSS